jgi:hypothetical protein
MKLTKFHKPLVLNALASLCIELIDVHNGFSFVSPISIALCFMVDF